ncbi:MAG TPA: elongation factor G, partial [Chthonomonadales bacterium]|nr:elongation factor G [Chthonomonadales bacterium]
VVIPEALLGDVMSDLTGKRGRITGTEPVGGGRIQLKATVPQPEMLRYAIDLRSITRGRGTFVARHSHYEEVPAHIAQSVVAAHKKEREAGEH